MLCSMRHLRGGHHKQCCYLTRMKWKRSYKRRWTSSLRLLPRQEEIKEPAVEQSPVEAHDEDTLSHEDVEEQTAQSNLRRSLRQRKPNPKYANVALVKETSLAEASPIKAHDEDTLSYEDVAAQSFLRRSSRQRKPNLKYANVALIKETSLAEESKKVQWRKDIVETRPNLRGIARYAPKGLTDLLFPKGTSQVWVGSLYLNHNRSPHPPDVGSWGITDMKDEILALKQTETCELVPKLKKLKDDMG
ncbi:hypothetical protein COLO4_16741 [Corchorus olitorius]|uniref:Uncharacterized protein n=1 Tax=Corchorus olitorius TaxID=93759 RepID=A0A1R3JFT9_9ROSI|nr:hypothetical protein COLO4_16741 [Corchorus olitorius]